VEEIGVTEILQVLETLVYVELILGVILALNELRTMSRDRKSELAMRMTEYWCTLEFQESAAKFLKARFTTPEEAEEQLSLGSLMLGASFFERLGYMVRKKLVPIDIVIETMPVEYTWEKIKPWARGEEIDDPERSKYPRATYPNYEWLANEDRKHRLAAEQKARSG
jgi:hypothetical protein